MEFKKKKVSKPKVEKAPVVKEDKFGAWLLKFKSREKVNIEAVKIAYANLK